MKGLPITEFTKEYKRKHAPNIRTLGGIYWTDTKYEPDDRVVHNFQEWHDWNCARCKYDFLTNKKETLERIEKNIFPYNCPIVSDIIINQFEYHTVPPSTLLEMGMNRYGIGTCAGFEEMEDES